MISTDTTPGRLAAQLLVYYALLVGGVVLLLQLAPDSVRYLPLGGNHALEAPDLQFEEVLPSLRLPGSDGAPMVMRVKATRPGHVGAVVQFLIAHLIGTVLVMMPVAWTYQAQKRLDGFSKNFARALLVLPVCATTIVLLIQDSLALAFGLAALVAAVRFRVNLDDTADAVAVFTAVCVGLAGGIGYLGIAAVLSLFYCMLSLGMWHTDFGRNPVEEAKARKKRHKREAAKTHADAGIPSAGTTFRTRRKSQE